MQRWQGELGSNVLDPTEELARIDILQRAKSLGSRDDFRVVHHVGIWSLQPEPLVGEEDRRRGNDIGAHSIDYGGLGWLIGDSETSLAVAAEDRFSRDDERYLSSGVRTYVCMTCGVRSYCMLSVLPLSSPIKQPPSLCDTNKELCSVLYYRKYKYRTVPY